MLKSMNALMEYAIDQYGQDRTYSVRFGTSTPIVTVTDNGDKIAELWTVNGEIQSRKFY